MALVLSDAHLQEMMILTKMEEEDFTVECWYIQHLSGTEKRLSIGWNWWMGIMEYIAIRINSLLCNRSGVSGDVSAGDIVFGKINGITLLLLEMEAPQRIC